MIINFTIIQFAPGGPVEQALYRLQHGPAPGYQGLSNQSDEQTFQNNTASGVSPEVLEDIKRQFGFDKPAHTRLWLMIKSYAIFDFGTSFFRNVTVIDLIIEKLPVSLSLGLWSTLLIYFISIPLGIKKAMKHGSRFDTTTSAILVVGYAIPGFLFAMILIIFFAGGSFLSWFPLKGLTSENFSDLSLINKIIDYFWHIALPLLAYTISGFATLTLLTKNSFLDEINKQYVITARSKGLNDKSILYKHVFRNAMLIIIAGFPAAFVSIFFTGSLLIEVIFSLDGIGLLSYEAIINRDYPVVFSTLYIFTLMALVLKLISDLTYHAVDPRISFDTRG